MTDPATSPALGAQPDRAATATATAVDEPPAVDEPAVEAAGPSVATYKDKAGRIHYASPHAPHTVKAVADGEWTQVDVDDKFDPTKELVRTVLKYLRENATDPAEIERVKAAEADGEDRVSIREWQPGQ